MSVIVAATGALAVAGSVFAQSATSGAPSSTPQASGSTSAVATQVVVEGKRADVGDRIDRRVYDIRSDPQSQTGTASDILGKLPSVQVTPTGKVTLRGDPGVTVLVDGKAPAAGNAVIQTLSAADIDRIEVMTNPSAQYAPDGAAGIINIITRKRHPLGLSGNVNARASSMGETVMGGSAVFTQGQWSIDSRLRYVHSPYRGDSAYSQSLPDAETHTGGWHGDAENLLGNLNIAYKLDDRSTLTLEGQDYSARGKTTDFGHFVSAARTYDGVVQSSTRNGQRDIEGVYDYNNEKTGAHFTLDADHTDYDAPTFNAETDTYGGGAQALYGFHRNTWGPEDNLKGDYELDFPMGRELTAGFELDHRVTHIDRTVFDTGAIAGPEADGFSHAFRGERSIYSAYATYQFALGKWTVLPGLRVEQQIQDVAADGLTARDDRVQLYPSLHVNRDLSATAKLKFSYSRRVQRPDISDYDPGVSIATPFSVETGNPNLKPSNADSYEAGYSSTGKDRNTDVTLFYRVTHDLQNEEHLAGAGGVVINRPVNAGTADYGGLDLTRKAPLWKVWGGRWKYTLNATVDTARVPQLSRARRFFSYTGNGVLQYDAAHGDQWQIAAGVTGRLYTIDGYTGGRSHVDLTWQHPLSKKVALVVSASDLFGGNRTVSVVDTPAVTSRSWMRPVDQVLRVALSWKFGAKK